MYEMWFWGGIASAILIIVGGLLWFRKRQQENFTDEAVSVKVPAIFVEECPTKQQILADSMNAGHPLTGKVDNCGNLFYEKGVSGCKEIVPLDPQDKALLACAQGATMNRCTLPSGLMTPPAEAGKVWKVVGNRLVLTEQNEQDPE